MKKDDIVGDLWRYAVSCLPDDFEDSCFDKLAIRRRRAVVSPEVLLRLCLAYSVCDLSLRQTAAWAAGIGLAVLSDVALLKRLQAAGPWLAHLVGEWLRQRGLCLPRLGARVRIVDATCLCSPGATETEYRLHLDWDLAQQRLLGVELTDKRGGEKLERHAVELGDIVVGDRGYAKQRGVLDLLRRQAHVVVRLPWNAIPLYTQKGRPQNMLHLLTGLTVGEVGDWRVWLRERDTLIPLRLVAVRKSPEAEARTLQHLKRRSQQRGQALHPNTRVMARYVAVLTDLPATTLPPVLALELYRLRWQIELAFKRLKSVLGLDNLRAHNPALAQTYLLSKLLGALILDELADSALVFFPWGFRLGSPHPHPPSLALAASLAGSVPNGDQGPHPVGPAPTLPA